MWQDLTWEVEKSLPPLNMLQKMVRPPENLFHTPHIGSLLPGENLDMATIYNKSIYQIKERI